MTLVVNLMSDLDCLIFVSMCAFDLMVAIGGANQRAHEATRVLQKRDHAFSPKSFMFQIFSSIYRKDMEHRRKPNGP